MQKSYNTVKVISLLDDIISELGVSNPDPVKSGEVSKNVSGIDILSNVIDEMNSVVIHDNTSVENLTLPHNSQENNSGQDRVKIRRGASRELASTVTAEIKRPEEESVVIFRRNSRMRRDASQDLSETITGPLKRPDDNESEDCQDSVLQSETSCDLFSTKTGDLKYATDAITVNCLDLRVGKILTVERHSAAEKLYCETVDVGEAEPRSIASGLVPYYSCDDLKDRLVVVVCNLKPRNLVGFPSNGMVLCATCESSDGSRAVELLMPPTGSKPGDRVFGAGLPGEVATIQKCDKKKIFQKVAVDLRVDEAGCLAWNDILLNVGSLSNGKCCTALTLRNAAVS